MSLRNEAYNSIKKKMRRLIVMDKISIIIPCFNEEEALPIYYAEMKKVMDSMKKHTSFELLFVDDGSSDRTYEIMKDLHRKDGRCQYLSFSRNFGKEAAIYAGQPPGGRGFFVAALPVQKIQIFVDILFCYAAPEGRIQPLGVDLLKFCMRGHKPAAALHKAAEGA